MRKNNIRLENVITLAPYKLEITYTDKSTVVVDISQLVKSLAIFSPLENSNEFASATISDFGFTLEWSCGASLDSDRLFEMAYPQLV